MSNELLCSYIPEDCQKGKLKPHLCQSTKIMSFILKKKVDDFTR